MEKPKPSRVQLCGARSGVETPEEAVADAEIIARLTVSHRRNTAIIDALKGELASVRAQLRERDEEIADLRISVIAFGAPAMVEWATEHGLPHNHLHPEHYDILKRAGARMDSFVRADLEAEAAHD